MYLRGRGFRKLHNLPLWKNMYVKFVVLSQFHYPFYGLRLFIFSNFIVFIYLLHTGNFSYDSVSHRTHHPISQPRSVLPIWWRRVWGCKLWDQVRGVIRSETTPHPHPSTNISRVRFVVGKQILREHHTQIYLTVLKLYPCHISTVVQLRS
jgi:hypothetical protein